MIALPLPLPLHIARSERVRGPRFDVCGPRGRLVATCNGQGEAEAIATACNATPAVLKALRNAAKLAWEVGCETEDGVHTLLGDSRGDLWRELQAAIALLEDSNSEEKRMERG